MIASHWWLSAVAIYHLSKVSLLGKPKIKWIMTVFLVASRNVMWHKEKKSRAMVKWALDKWLSIQVNLWWYAHHSTVTQPDKMGCSQLLCQFACLTSRLLYHLVWYSHSLTITYFSSETMNWVVWWHLYIKWKENWRKGGRGKFNFLGFLH